MAPTPELRAGDADRDRVISQLQGAYSEGRLTLAEFNDRMAAATAARTFGDLDILVNDLPATAVPAPASGAVERLSHHTTATAWASWAGVSLLLIFIWFMSGRGYFWPAWAIVPWGIGMGIKEITERRGGESD